LPKPHCSSPDQTRRSDAQTYFITREDYTSPNTKNNIFGPELTQGDILTVKIGGKKYPAKALLLVAPDEHTLHPSRQTGIRYNPYYKKSPSVDETSASVVSHTWTCPQKADPTPVKPDISTQSLINKYIIQPNIKTHDSAQPVKCESVQPTKVESSDSDSVEVDVTGIDKPEQKPVFTFYHSGPPFTTVQTNQGQSTSIPGTSSTNVYPKCMSKKSTEEKKRIKMEQNKTAAQRYRMKKRQEQAEHASQKESLLKRRAELENEAKTLELEVSFLKNLLIETRIHCMKSKP